MLSGAIHIPTQQEDEQQDEQENNENRFSVQLTNNNGVTIKLELKEE